MVTLREMSCCSELCPPPNRTYWLYSEQEKESSESSESQRINLL
jgi:hypothetical protein